MFIPPPLLLLIAIGISYGVSKLIPSFAFINQPLSTLGLILIALGIGLFIWTVQFFEKHKTTLDPRGKPSRLITEGPYRLTRNPIYLGFFLIALGTALFFANILAIVGPILFFFFISTFIIPFEEETLGRTFGKTYQNYRKQIRRWL
jgi:protein-S-isoprenylcysteine O-methyltransferase Ste14